MSKPSTNPLADTPRTDACPHCGSPRISPLCAYFTCEADTTQRDEDKRTHLCREREKSQKLEAEVKRLKKLLLTEKESDVVGLAIVNFDVHTAVERRCINSAASKLRQHKL